MEIRIIIYVFLTELGVYEMEINEGYGIVNKTISKYLALKNES